MSSPPDAQAHLVAEPEVSQAVEVAAQQGVGVFQKPGVASADVDVGDFQLVGVSVVVKLVQRHGVLPLLEKVKDRLERELILRRQLDIAQVVGHGRVVGVVDIMMGWSYMAINFFARTLILFFIKLELDFFNSFN